MYLGGVFTITPRLPSTRVPADPTTHQFSTNWIIPTTKTIITRPFVDDHLISQAATQIIQAGTKYKETCLQMRINLDTNGTYLGSTGNDYQRLKRVVKKMRMREATRMLRNVTGTQKSMLSSMQVCISYACCVM